VTRDYWCFISYRHADNVAPGRQWATWLHQAIETYEVPGDLVGKTNGRGDVIPQRIFPVFRDETDLPANAHLASGINDALAVSKVLLVICSPRAAASTYVADEIRYFKQLGRHERVLAALIDGEPNVSWDQKKRDDLGFEAKQECFPKPLQFRVNAEGHLLEDEHVEPIAPDFRLPDGTEGWTSPEAYRLALNANLNLTAAEKAATVEAYRKRCEQMKLKILAGILGVSADDLIKRDAAYQLALARRRARIRNAVLAVVSVLAIAAVLAAVSAYRAQQQAIAEKDHALEAFARSDFLQAEALIKVNKIAEAMPFLARSLRTRQKDNPAAALVFHYLPALAMPVSSFTHEGAVVSAKFSPDGKRIVTASEDKTARVWDVQPHGAARPPLQHQAKVVTASFSPDGKRVVTASYDATAQVWDVQTGQPVSPPLKHENDLSSASFSPDGTRVVTASQDQTARVWDARTGQPAFPPLRHGDAVMMAEFSPDGKWLVTASWEGIAQVWDAQTGQPIGAPLQHQKGIYSANFSPDGKWIATASDDDTARVWDAATGKAITPPLPQMESCTSASFSPDGRWLVTASKDHMARVWDVRTGQPVCAPASA
jgi:hypothetical protein